MSSTGGANNLNWKKINKEAIRHFKNLLCIDTTNPPGNELLAVTFLKKIFTAEKIKSTVIRTDKNRACIIARLPSKRNTKSPLILTSHLDVVPHEPDQWDYPAFKGIENDGYIYGRGAVDMKNMTAMSLMTMLLLKRLNAELDREIIFTAVADEEAGSAFGMEYLVEKHSKVFNGAEYALNEIGAFTLHQGGKRFYPIQVAEKGFVWIKIEIEGKPGH